MKIYTISIKRFKTRFEYISSHVLSKSKKEIINVGVDGYDLNLGQFSPNFNSGQIGCALSHIDAYRKLVESDDPCSFIVEDDVLLPSYIDNLLDEIEGVIQEDEIFFLYNRNITRCEYSNENRINLKTGKLYMPMSTKNLRTAAAYVVGRVAAKRLSDFNQNVVSIADNWNMFYENDTFSNPYVLVPNVIKMAQFPSTIGYSQNDSFLVKTIKQITNSLGVYSFVRKIRLSYLFWKKERNYKIVKSQSPYDKNKK